MAVPVPSALPKEVPADRQTGGHPALRRLPGRRDPA